MSEFSSGAFKPFGTPLQFPLNQHKFGGVRASEAEDDNCQPQNVKWRVQDSNIHMEGVAVTSDHGGSFLSRADSALTLASSATFDQFNEHVLVDEIFPRDAAGYEPSNTNNLQYSSSSSHAQLEEFYRDYQSGEGRWQQTVTPDPNDACNSSDVLVVIPGNSQDTITKPLAYHLAPSNRSPLNFTFPGSFSFAKLNPPSSRLQLASSPSGIANNSSPPVATTAMGLNYKAAAAAYRNSPKRPISEPKGFQSRLGRGGREETAAAVSNMALGLSSQSMATVNYQHALKVARTTSDFTHGKRQLYGSRLSTDHLEHVQRERQRRDDMSAKIATLETLLPAASKRDRVSIVHDGIHYVRALQQKVKILQEQLREAKRKAEAYGVQDKKWRPSLVGSSSKLEFGSSSRNSMTRSSQGALTFTAGSPSSTAEFQRSGLSNSASTLGITPKTEPIHTRGAISVEFHVQVDRPGEQVQVVKCECRYSYLSSVMRTLDQLQLSLHLCSITKLHDYVICVIVIKPTSNCSTAHTVSSAQIATLLKIAARESQ